MSAMPEPAQQATSGIALPARLVVSTRSADVDVARVHHWLAHESHWARGLPRAVLLKAIANSLCFSAFAVTAEGERQVGFARVVTDRAVFAYLCDVFVDSAWRGQGVARQLMQAIQAHPDLQGLRRFALVTSDAHGLYERYGFGAVAQPHKWMERHDPHVYAAASPASEGAAHG